MAEIRPCKATILDNNIINKTVCCLQIYKHPKGQSVLGARLQLPALLLSYNGTGEKLAAAGDDECIHIINIKLNKDTDALKVRACKA